MDKIKVTMRAPFKLAASAMVTAAVFALCNGFTTAADQQQEPGKAAIGRSYKDSKPHWEPLPQAPKGAPNVIYLVLDDVGFAQLGCYGSEIKTPNIDRLATGGLRYSNFHTTSLCSPSRACLLTGANHHTNHLGVITEAATGYPGYDGRMPRSQATVAEILKQMATALHISASGTRRRLTKQATRGHSIAGRLGWASNGFTAL